jgi:hypothetical protein
VPNLADKNIIRKLIQEVETNQNRERKKRDFESYQTYAGNQREYVWNILKRTYPESYEIMRVSNVNVVRKVVDKKAKVYADSPKRTVNGMPNERLDDIYKQGHFNEAYSLMDTIYNRSNCALVWVQNDPVEKTKFRLVPLNQYSFDLVINNDTFELEAVILSYPGTDITTSDRVSDSQSDSQNQILAESQYDSTANSKSYSIWTKEMNVNIRATSDVNGGISTIDYMPNDANPKNINPLGMLPFVWVTTQPTVPEFPTPSPLHYDSWEINILGSNLLTATQMQIGQLVLKYPVGSKINTIFKGFKIALELPQSTDNEPLIPTEAEYIVPNSDISGMKDVLYEYSASILADNGLEGASLSGKNQMFTSGFERLIANASVVNIQKENSEKYKNVETSVFEIIKRYDAINVTRLFNIDDELNVYYQEPTIIRSEMEKLDIIERREDIGLMEEFEKFQLDNPTLSRKEAIAKMQRIQGGEDANNGEELSKRSNQDQE